MDNTSLYLILWISLTFMIGGLLVLMEIKSRRKGIKTGVHSLRVLMGWCFIWILERLSVETFELEGYRWIFLSLAAVASVVWYINTYIRMNSDSAQKELEEKVNEMGRN